MNFTIFNIGLALLSRNISQKKALSTEGKRILSLLEGRDIADHEIAREEGGRPFFKDRHSDFNISHSGDMAAVSIIKRGGLYTGCDIQLIKNRTNTIEIAKKFFSVSECNYILQNENKNCKTRFFEIWTLKECYLKLRGLSVFDMAKGGSFISETDGAFIFGAAASSPLSFYLYSLNGGSKNQYMLAVAVEGAEVPEPSIHWFSQSTLSCSLVAKIEAGLS
jgi:hypothetical protein